MSVEPIEEIKTAVAEEIDLKVEGGKQCRICYDGDNSTSPMIAPCLCKGDLKYVHRECLDKYRIINEGMVAFSQCNTCQFKYLFQVNGKKRCLSPKCLFRLTIMGDILVVLLFWGFIIGGFAFLVHFKWKKDWLLSVGYGSIGLFGVLAFPLMIYACCRKDSVDVCGHQCFGTCDCCSDCRGDCNCGDGDCDCDGEGGGEAILICCIIIAVIGFIFALIFSLAVITALMRKHYEKYNKSLLARYILS